MALALGTPFLLGESAVLSNAGRAFGIIDLIDEILPQPGVATSSVTQTHTLPAGAIVLGASYTVTAKPAGLVTVNSVAQVRPGTGHDLVVDFQGMRTVERLIAPDTITGVEQWAGTQFASDQPVVASGTNADQQFTEVQTERLLVTLASAVDPEAFASQGSVTVLSPPADLELDVAGTRSWFNAGPARPGGSANDPAAFETTVDLTAAVIAAVAAAPVSPDGTVDVDVVLRSSVPGQLTLKATLLFQSVFPVAFPEGDARVVDASEEGVFDVALPLPGESSGWQIHEAQMTVSGALATQRVLPPDGPASSGGAELVLDPDHAVLVGLAAASLARFATLSGLRLLVGVDAGGAELAGVLRADAGGSPGDPLPQGKLGPVTLAAGDLARPAWTTLPLAREHKLAANERLWVGLQLARGRLSWPLAVPFAPAPPPALDANAPIRRQLPNGAFRPLSTAGDVPTTAATLRLAGEAPQNAPIPALEVDIEGTGVRIPLTPAAGGVPVAIRLDPPLTRAGTPAAFDDSGALRLRLTTKTAGSVSFTAVRVAYTT